MFDTAEKYEGQLLAGEDNRFEFKELRLPDRGVPDPNAKSTVGGMVAFANAGGGKPGENDAGVSLGIPQERLNTAERWFVNLAANNAGGRKAMP